MGSIVSTLFGNGIEGAGKGIASVVNAIKGKNPEDAIKLQEILGRHSDLVTQTEADVAKAEAQANIALNQNAGENIRQETSSTDAFVRRARPAFLWVMTFALAFNLILPLISQFFGGSLTPLPIDSGLYGIFSSGFLGYTIARTVEKTKGV